MTKTYCNRCRREIAKDVYVIRVYGEPSLDGRVSGEVMANNIREKSKGVFAPEEHYCKNCVDLFREFLENKQ